MMQVWHIDEAANNTEFFDKSKPKDSLAEPSFSKNGSIK